MNGESEAMWGEDESVPKKAEVEFKVVHFVRLIAKKTSFDERPDVVCPRVAIVPRQARVRIRRESGAMPSPSIHGDLTKR